MNVKVFCALYADIVNCARGCVCVIWMWNFQESQLQRGKMRIQKDENGKWVMCVCVRCVIFNLLKLRQRQPRWWWCLWWWLRTPAKWKRGSEMKRYSHRFDNPCSCSGSTNGHMMRVNNDRIDHHTSEYEYSVREHFVCLPKIEISKW